MKLLALIALVLVGTYLLSSIVNTPNFAGLSSVVDMIKGGPGYPIDAPGGKAKGMYQNESSLVMLNETTIYFITPAEARFTVHSTVWEIHRWKPAEPCC